MGWEPVLDTIFEIFPSGQNSISATPFLIPGLTGAELLILATCPTARADWWLAFRLAVTAPLLGSPLGDRPIESLIFFQRIQLATPTLIKIPPQGTAYTIGCSFPDWLGSLQLQIWQSTGEISAAAPLFWQPGEGQIQAELNTGYRCSGPALTTITLPPTAAVGSRLIVAADSAGGWRIAQNSGQIIRVGHITTTPGQTGRVDSTDAGDLIELVCLTQNSYWVAVAIYGNLDVN